MPQLIPYIIGAAVVAGTAYSAVSSSDAASESKKQSKEQKAQVALAEKNFQDEQSNLEKSEAGKAARNKQKDRAARATGRSSTLLTSPVGVLGEPEGVRKTLLGT